jgi:Na+/melibiose symporter-like transporter
MAYNSAILVTYGVPVSDVGYIWALHETFNLTISPFIGSASDHSRHPMGRRRFYITWALAGGVVGILLFSNADDLGMLMGDTEDDHVAGIVLAVLGLIVSHIARRARSLQYRLRTDAYWYPSGFSSWQVCSTAVEVVQALARCLVAEVVAQENQPDANNYFTVNGGVGTILGFGLGSVNLVAASPFFNSNYQALYLSGAVFLIITTTTTLVLTEEPSPAPAGAEEDGGGNAGKEEEPWSVGRLREIWKSFVTIPRPVARAIVAQFLHVCGWVWYTYFASDWFGVHIYGGSSDEFSPGYAEYQSGEWISRGRHTASLPAPRC